jgi:cytidine deaminase
VGSDGELFAGCNVENGSYGLTQCAERNALCAAMATGQQAGEMKALLVYSDGFKSLSPCGACRQVMSELLSNDAVIISCSDGEEPQYWIMGQLLPDPFVLK